MILRMRSRVATAYTWSGGEGGGREGGKVGLDGLSCLLGGRYGC